MDDSSQVNRQISSPARRRLRRSAAFVLAAALAVPNVALFSARGADTPPRPGALRHGTLADRPNQVNGNELNAEAQAAMEKGLAWLAHRQLNGNAPNARFGGYSNNTAITALAGLAFMEAGNLPGRGKYGREVQRCLDFTLNTCQESGLISADASQGPMYGHGFATLFLGEIYGMTQDEAVKEKLTRAVRLIEKVQNPEGGWRYQPVPYDADISVTICQVMGLRAARDAGIKVDKGVIDRAIAYVKRCQNPDGGFSYMEGGGGGFGGGGSMFARSAAGVAALYYAGVFEGNEIENGLRYVRQFSPESGTGRRGGFPGEAQHYYYGYYYATQVMFLAGGDYWASFFPAIRDELIARQKGTPGADHWEGDVNEDYATAMALIIMGMPNRYLPVFAGKGPGS
jgi:hypothetical protein